MVFTHNMYYNVVLCIYIYSMLYNMHIFIELCVHKHPRLVHATYSTLKIFFTMKLANKKLETVILKMGNGRELGTDYINSSVTEIKDYVCQNLYWFRQNPFKVCNKQSVKCSTVLVFSFGKLNQTTT